MTERVEEIRRWKDRMSVSADPGSLFGYSLTAIADLLTALAQAELEVRLADRLDKLNLLRDNATMRAEVERLKGELQDEHLAYVDCTRDRPGGLVMRWRWWLRWRHRHHEIKRWRVGCDFTGTHCEVRCECGERWTEP